MFGHASVVIGASVGGVDALPRLIGSLPADLPASVFVVLHSAPQGPGLLPDIIRKTSAMAVRHAVDGEKILLGGGFTLPNPITTSWWKGVVSEYCEARKRISIDLRLIRYFGPPPSLTGLVSRA
jgi:hypothetical protein